MPSSTEVTRTKKNKAQITASSDSSNGRMENKRRTICRTERFGFHILHATELEPTRVENMSRKMEKRDAAAVIPVCILVCSSLLLTSLCFVRLLVLLGQICGYTFFYWHRQFVC